MICLFGQETMKTSYTLTERDISTAIAEWVVRQKPEHKGSGATVTLSHTPGDRPYDKATFSASVTIEPTSSGRALNED